MISPFASLIAWKSFGSPPGNCGGEEISVSMAYLEPT